MNSLIMFKTLVVLLCLHLSWNLVSGGKFLKKIENLHDGIVRAYGYKPGKENGFLCMATRVFTYRKIGWETVEVNSYPDGVTDEEQATCGGEVEAVTTYDVIYHHYFNNVKLWCKGREDICDKVYAFLDEHLDWVKKTIAEKSATDPLWHQVSIYYSFIQGLYNGYQESQFDIRKNITMLDFLVMNLQEDLEDVAAALTTDTSAKVRGDSHCSAIIKLLPNNADLLTGHTTWSSYTSMYRMLKKYNMPFRVNGKDKNKFAPGQIISFSGYPGVISSVDDFYVVSTKLVALETTIGNYNASRWQYVKPTGQLFDSVRSLAALRLSKTGDEWCKTFSQYNSGTYNNQWMIVDYNKFKDGKTPKAGTLYILEQIPGYVRYEDQTNLLVSQSYWPSYNVPFYTDVFNMAGNQALVDEYGDWFSYNYTPRALIFKRDHSSVSDINSLFTLLRSNDYKNDPDSRCNCTPPYSAENAIAARSDLNPANGKYPFPALGHRPHGAIDAKVISPLNVNNMTFWAVNGPTTGNNLPPFQWNKSDFKDLPHRGQVNSFTKFHPYLTFWYSP